MVQYIAQEFHDMIDKVENVTGWHVSVENAGSSLYFLFWDPDDEPGDLDVDFHVEWTKIWDRDFDDCVEYLVHRFKSKRNQK